MLVGLSSSTKSLLDILLNNLSMPGTTPPSPGPISSNTTSCDHGRDPCREPGEATDINVAVIVAAIVCAFLCALGLNSMLRCVFRCVNRVVTEPVEWVTSRRLNSGLKKKEMVALPSSIYADPAGGSPSSPSGCAICLTDYSEGDAIRVLPKCNHRFHVVCIDKWLLCHSSCPTCRNRLNSSANNMACTV